MCFANEDIKLLNNMMQPLELNRTGQSLWSDQCGNIDLEDCTNLNKTNMNLVTLCLNICSLLSHQSELIELISKLEQKNLKVDILFLCETFLMNQTMKMVNVPGYTLIAYSCQHIKGGGIAILINK